MFSLYHNIGAELRKYFMSDSQLLYCSDVVDVEGFLLAMELPAYNPSE